MANDVIVSTIEQLKTWYMFTVAISVDVRVFFRQPVLENG